MKLIDKFYTGNCVFVQDASEPNGLIGELAPNNQTFEDRPFSNEFVLVWNRNSADESNCSVYKEKLHGLCLSDNVLIKLGFAQNESIFSLSALTIKKTSRSYYEISCKGIDSANISYLHQLQNYCRAIGEGSLLREAIKPLIGITYKDFRQQYE